MDWCDETWVKLYRRDTADWLLLSWRARGLFCLLLRAVNRSGVLDLGKTGSRAVAVHVRGEWHEIGPALEELLGDGCVRINGAALVIPNFVNAQDAAMSDRARSKVSRERKRDEAMGVTKRDGTVTGFSGTPNEGAFGSDGDHDDEDSRDTKRDDTDTKRDASITKRDGNVTGGHAASRAVTPRHEEKRREEKILVASDATNSPAGGVDGKPPTQGGLFAQPKADEPREGPKSARKATGTTKLPFKIHEALDAIAAAAQGRVARVEPRDIRQGHSVSLVAHIRAYPELGEWQRVGEWLAAGALPYRSDLGLSWAASAALNDAMAQSREWVAKGRPSLAPRSSQIPTPPSNRPERKVFDRAAHDREQDEVCRRAREQQQSRNPRSDSQ